MNRRTFLTALGAVATTQKLGTWKLADSRLEPEEEPPIIPVSITRYPYVQNVRKDRASILWATVDVGIGHVSYSADGVNFRTVTATSRFFSRAETGLLTSYVQYQADLTGLTENTDYIYTVNLNGQNIIAVGETRFRTAGPGSFRFLVVGDSGWGDPLNDGQGLVARRVALEKPALLIHTGDLVYNPGGTYESYQRKYFNYFADTMSSVPFFPCPGNHDYEVANAVPYVTIHSLPTDGVPVPDRGRYYSFDWSNVHFVSIDSAVSLNRAVNSNGPMLRWLDNDLRSTRQFWRVVYFHHPPWATGNNQGDVESAWGRTYLTPIFERNGVQLVICGHEHSYQRSVPIRNSSTVSSGIGTHYFTSGGGGAILYPVPDKTMIAFARREYHYLRAEVQGLRINIRSISQLGAELDNYSIAPTPAFSDAPRVAPVTLTPGPVAGATIRIIGRNLAGDEMFACTPTPPIELAGTVVTVNGNPIQLLYVSPSQIYAVLPFPVEGNITIRVTTANGFVERSI